MEKAVDNLESLFQKAETDLNYLSRKVDFQLEKEQGLNSQESPLRLMKAVEEIKSEYSALVQEIAAIGMAQKEAIDFFRSQLLAMVQALEKLETQTGENPQLAAETMAQFEEISQLMGIPKEDLLPQPHNQDDKGSTTEQAEASGGTAAAPAASSSGTSTSSESTASSTQSGDNDLKSQAPVLSAFERRTCSKDFIDVTQEEFLTVSELVRGKVKLEDLNRTYKMLWQHFKEEGNTEALTPKDMNSMGLRVAGATGQAKLKTLRALKLCQISKQGDVTLS